MNENTTNQPNALTESYPAQRVSDDLRLRVKHLAAQHDDKADQRAQSRRKRRRVLSYGAAALVIGCGIALQPRIATATALSRMSAAMEGIQTAHILSWQTRSVTDSTRTESETWFSGDSVRLKSEGGIQIFRDGKNYFYSPERNRVVVKSAEGAFGHNRSGFSVAAMKRDIARWGWSDRIETLGMVNENGRSYKQLALYRDEPAGKIRVLFLVDPKTDLPQRCEVNLLKDGRWEVFGGTELRYNETLDPKLFVVNFPGAQIVNYDQERKRWHQEMENTVAEVKVGERTVKIRDVRVNEQGAIFVLYTCGKTYEDALHQTPGSTDWWPGIQRDWKVELTDSEGTKYVHEEIKFMSSMDKARKRESFGVQPILKDGEIVQGDWFIPLTAEPKTPTSVTLHVRAHPKDLHGKELHEAYWGKSVRAIKTQLTPHSASTQLFGAKDDRVRESEWIAKGTLTLQPQQQPGFLPDYWPHVVDAMRGDDDKELRGTFEALRSASLAKHRATLPLALRSLELQQTLTPEPRTSFWLEKATVLGLLKRPEEAKQALQAAIARQEIEVKRYPEFNKDDGFFWQSLSTVWYAIGDEKKAIEMREKAMKLEQRNFPARVQWYREHPEDLKPKLD